ncbi:activity-dependent neuroprotective protein 2a [Misgurnus anguillicaudatus]|uniref:activity-dependent neuroprotective protein 2a n=1 Tax=Misgurnus anguillicaudatus TaxID=75329 RepID=UPI003CCF37BD
MYQVPVKNLTELRRPRKRVKSILSDIGMQQCQELIETYKDFDTGDASFNGTEWDDFTDGHVGKKRKKHPYRSQALCCNLCRYGSESVTRFRTHLFRCHEHMLDLACLLLCPHCPFVDTPKVTDQHMKLFHGIPSKGQAIAVQNSPRPSLAHTSRTVSVTISADAADDRYICATCGYHDSLLYVMKKHVLVNHYAMKLDHYFGLGPDRTQKKEGEQKRDGTVKYHCKVCKLPAETIEHLLYHILSSEKHKDLNRQIMPSIIEKNCSNQIARQPNLLSLKPKAMQQVTLVARSNYMQQQMQQTNGNGISKSNGTVLMAGPSNTAALFCSPGGGQMFLSPQTQALYSGATVTTLQNRQQQPSAGLPQVLPSSQIVKPINMMMPNMSQSTHNTVPITMTMPRLPQPQQAQKVVFPPGLQVNLPAEMGVRPPILVTPGLQLNHSVPRSPLITSQSVRLIPTGNQVNGVPTYTLAPVQVTVPVQGNPAQMLLTHNTPHVNQPPNSAVVPAGLMPTIQRAINRNAVPNELAVLAPFLKKHNDCTVKCLRCKILLTEQGIFQHLLHGLKCLFCPQMFYSFKQIMHHSTKEHSLTIKQNRDFIKEQFSLDCDEKGNLMFTTFNLNTDVPKDLLDNRELNLALITSFQEKIYIKMYPDKAEYPTTLKATPTNCQFCPVKFETSEEYEQHLQSEHHVVPTVHAILKTPAFKCIYCYGVYTEKSTPKTISIHVQRCRCAPKAVKEAERKLNPDTMGRLDVDLCSPVQTGNSSEVISENKVDCVKPKRESTGEKRTRRKVSKNRASVFKNTASVSKNTATVSKNTVAVSKNTASVSKNTASEDPPAPVELVLDPTGMEMTSFEDRKEFLSRYFHRKPYVTKTEMELLASRLYINKGDVKAHFNTKLTKCLKAIQKKKTYVLLGFKMNDVNRLQHNLYIPVVQPVKRLKTEITKQGTCLYRAYSN